MTRRNPQIPDTYIDPFTGEERKVEEWSDPDAPPLNSPRWASHSEEGLDLPEDPEEAAENRSSPWLCKQQRMRLLWWYVAAVLLFLLLNFWVFHEGIFALFRGN